MTMHDMQTLMQMAPNCKIPISSAEDMAALNRA
jgi:hypothetical protein